MSQHHQDPLPSFDGTVHFLFQPAEENDKPATRSPPSAPAESEQEGGIVRPGMYVETRNKSPLDAQSLADVLLSRGDKRANDRVRFARLIPSLRYVQGSEKKWVRR
jgi:hypothetical protein